MPIRWQSHGLCVGLFPNWPQNVPRYRTEVTRNHQWKCCGMMLPASLGPPLNLLGVNLWKPM
jgi:hypothetical protein